jgi:DNA-directed RNA polymerase subunit RPC12/RpoP
MPASNNTAARRYLDLLRHVLCRDRFPDAGYDMSSGSLQVTTGYSCPRCGEEIRLNARKFRA